MCRRSRPADKNLKSGLVHSTKAKTIPEKDDNMWHHLPSSNLWCYISMTTTCYDDLSVKREYFFDLIGEKHVHWHMVPKISNFFVIEPQMSSCIVVTLFRVLALGVRDASILGDLSWSWRQVTMIYQWNEHICHRQICGDIYQWRHVTTFYLRKEHIFLVLLEKNM